MGGYHLLHSKSKRAAVLCGPNSLAQSDMK